MTAPTTEYRIKIINSYEEYEEPRVINFICHDPEDVKLMVAAYCGYASGDPIEVFINDDAVVLDGYWGLKDVR